jgi:hypothetical protein
MYTTVLGLLHHLVAELTVTIIRLAVVELKNKRRSRVRKQGTSMNSSRT